MNIDNSHRICCFSLLSLAVWLGAILPAPAADEDAAFWAKVEKMAYTRFFKHEWNESDHTVEGDDWSLPPAAKSAPRAAIQIQSEQLLPDDFPCRLQRVVNWKWRDAEPEEGRYDFEGFRNAILKASEGGKYAIRASLIGSVYETRWYNSVRDHTIQRIEPGSGPLWLANHNVPILSAGANRSIPFHIFNYDIYHPEYHKRYMKLLEAFSKSGIPQMNEITAAYVHLSSGSRGEEGSSPEIGSPQFPLYVERMETWAKCFGENAWKLNPISYKPDDIQFTVGLGMGQRNGFVEHYMTHAKTAALGQGLDEENYLVVDESAPLIEEVRSSGDENEHYYELPGLEIKFGAVETFPHRYRESTLRMLQMRRTWAWVENGRYLVDPPLLNYLALELAHTVESAPDAWCELRESNIFEGKGGPPIPVKNFERWLYQRDAEGARTEAVERVDVTEQMFEYHPEHRYDLTARKTIAAEGQKEIRFAVDDRFLSGGPHRVAVKITFLDRNDAEWELRYFSNANTVSARPVRCGASGEAKTVTFILDDAWFPGQGYKGPDLIIHANKGDATIRFVRIVKL